MPSSNRWRINISAGNNASYVEITRLQMMSVIGGTTITTGGTASASSEYPGQPAADAFDTNDITWWSSASGANGIGWLEYQFASPVSIVQYKVKTNSGATYAPKSWTFEYYNGSSWSVVNTQSNEVGWVGLQERTYTFGEVGRMPIVQSIPVGPVVTINQNQAYALPAYSVIMFTDAAASLQQSTDVGFTASVPVTLAGGQAQLAGGFLKCTSGNISVVLKSS